MTPDVVLVDIDRDALHGIRHVAAIDIRPVVLIVDDIAMPSPAVKPILRAAVALFSRHRQAWDDLKQAEGRLQERAVIYRAKALLIKQRRLNEPDAHKWLRRGAMSGARRIVDVAHELINEGEGRPG